MSGIELRGKRNKEVKTCPASENIAVTGPRTREYEPPYKKIGQLSGNRYRNFLARTPDLLYTPATFALLAMFAVVDIAGFQEKVQVGDTLSVPLQAAEKHKKIVFGNVLMLVKDGGDLVLGAPFIDGASVEVKVIEHGKAKKIRVFKMRRRKRYMRTKGHKQQNTTVEVTAIKV